MQPRDEKSILRTARKEGIAEGLEEGRIEGREEGLEEGRKEGIVEGRAEGREEGLGEGKLAVACNLLGLLSDDAIAQASGLPVSVIQSLREAR